MTKPFKKYDALALISLMLMSTLANAAYYNASAGMRDVAIHYPNDGKFRTMHGHTDMDNIPFGSAFSENHSKGTAPDYFKVWIEGRNFLTFYVRGAYTYNVYALPCDKTATVCQKVNLVNRVAIIKQGVSDGVSPLRVDTPLFFSLLDTAYLSDKNWGVTFCTGLEHNNGIYKVDDAACPGLAVLPPPECPLGEY